MIQKRDLSTSRLLAWSLTVLVIYAEFVSFSDSRLIPCEMLSVEEGQVATLTCDYGQMMYPGTAGKDIIIQREKQGDPDRNLEDILDCYWEDGATQYKCNTFGIMADFSINITRYVKVYFPAVSKKDEGKYYCKTVGSGIRSKACSLKLKEGGGGSGWKAAFFVILFVFLIPALLLLAVLIYYYRFRSRYLQNKAVVVSNAVESLISMVCSMKLTNTNFENPERVSEAWQLVCRVDGGRAEDKITPEVAVLMKQLWKDQGLQKFVRENEYSPSAAEYFLNALDRIAAPDYRPTAEDMDRTWTTSADAKKTAFTFRVLHCMILMLTDPVSSGTGGALPEEGGSRETDPLLASNKLLALARHIRPHLLIAAGPDWNSSNAGCIPPRASGTDNKEELSAAENALFAKRNEPFTGENEGNKRCPTEGEDPTATEKEGNTGDEELDAKVKEVETEVEKFNTRVEELDTRVEELDTGVDELASATKVEEPNMEEKRLSKKEEKVSPQGKEDKQPLWDVEKGL